MTETSIDEPVENASSLCMEHSEDHCCVCIQPKDHSREFAVCASHGARMLCTDDYPGRTDAIRDIMLRLGDLTEGCLDTWPAQKIAIKAVNDAIRASDPK